MDFLYFNQENFEEMFPIVFTTGLRQMVVKYFLMKTFEI